MIEDNFLTKDDIAKLVDWLRSLQRPDGGFSESSKKLSYISFTYYIVRCLFLLDATGCIDKKKIIRFTLSAKHHAGGFGNQPGQKPDLLLTKHVIFLMEEITM